MKQTVSINRNKHEKQTDSINRNKYETEVSINRNETDSFN